MESGGQNGQQITVQPIATTTYTVTTQSNGTCPATDVVTVNVAPGIIANAGLNQSICSGASATLLASGGNCLFVESGGANTSQITVSPNAQTTYIRLPLVTPGCSATDPVDVLINPSPIAFAGLDSAICIGGSITLSASGGISIYGCRGIKIRNKLASHQYYIILYRHCYRYEWLYFNG
ncbi:MAG: hypothetical protein IPP51_10705 [Bacteroidetes bacterium]|nr:hypothetical protein [Bacteroidota bacterium]